MKDENRQKIHDKIDHIFRDLLPAQGMAERLEQIALSHWMLDAMLDGGIALCDAGTGSGKTFAYLVAGIVFQQFQTTAGMASRPILISTSSIALQNAVQNEYLPLLSASLMADDMVTVPIRAVIRKGKSHYVCEERLERRLGQLDLSKKNWKAGAALLSLREQLDLDEAARLSHYDRERVCVPEICDCKREACRYYVFLDACDAELYPFQICNHNLLLADVIHRGTNRSPILPESWAVIIDEAHKLPETARQMFGITLRAEDIQDLLHELRKEKYVLAAESLADVTRPFLRKLGQPYDPNRPFSEYAWLLIAPGRTLEAIKKQINSLVSPTVRKRLDKLYSAVCLFRKGHPDMVFYAKEDDSGSIALCAAVSDLTAQLQSTLWNQPRPFILTSGTLAVGNNFRRFREEAGLQKVVNITESVSPSPFDYQKNCLLYLPQLPPCHEDEEYFDKLADEIAALLKVACGHALVLFTSYIAMAAAKERLAQKGLEWPLFTLGRSAVHTTEQFKANPGSVLLATGAAWEGFDFPGDCDPCW